METTGKLETLNPKRLSLSQPNTLSSLALEEAAAQMHQLRDAKTLNPKPFLSLKPHPIHDPSREPKAPP